MKSYVNKLLGSSFLLEPITLGGAALIAGGTALANWLFNKEQGSSNVGRSKDLMDYQQLKQQQYQKWLSAMQFPSMVASLRSAGLNPNLALGGTPSQPMASAPSASYNQNPTQVDIMSALSLASQIENTKADTEVKKEEAKKVANEAENISEQTNYQKFINEHALEQFEASIDQMKSVTALNQENKDLIHQNIQNQKKEFENLVQVNENLKKEGRKLDEEIKQIEPQAKAMIAERWANVKFMNNQDKREMAKNIWEVEYYSALAADTGMTMQLKSAQKKLVTTQERLIDKYGDAQAVTGMVYGGINTLANGIGTIMDMTLHGKGKLVGKARRATGNGSYYESYEYE